MKISAIQTIPTQENDSRKNLFIRLSNSFMSSPETESPVEKANTINPINKPAKLGIENLQEFTIFPKEVKDGQTIITA